MYINRELLVKFLATVAGLGSEMLWRLEMFSLAYFSGWWCCPAPMGSAEG